MYTSSSYNFSNQNIEQIRKFEESQQIERLLFFRFLMATIGFTCFVSLIIFLIEEQDYRVIVFMASLFVINSLLILISFKLKRWLQHILAILYIFYVGTAIVIGKFKAVSPFMQGYSCSMMFFSIIQYCGVRFKIFYLLSTPCIMFVLFDELSAINMQQIFFTISNSILLGLVTYQFENKQKSIFYLEHIIKKLQQNFYLNSELIKNIQSECLFILSYDERQRIFKLEFSNYLFDNQYRNDSTEFLRSHIVISEDEKSPQKRFFNTLEEYIYENQQKQLKWEQSQVVNLKIKNKQTEKILEISVRKLYLLKPVFVISIQQCKVNFQTEKFIKEQRQLKEIIISLLMDSGIKLQNLYQQLDKIIKLQSKNTFEVCKAQQQIILLLLTKIKNYQIYYHQDKLDSLKISISQSQIKSFLQVIMMYFNIRSKQQFKRFVFASSNFNENLILKVDQKLLTQLLINIFETIMHYCANTSIIKLRIEEKDQFIFSNHLSFDNSFTTKQQTSDYKFIQQLQFKFSFSSNQNISTFNSAFINNKKKMIVIHVVILNKLYQDQLIIIYYK